jgi:hypothetical protein
MNGHRSGQIEGSPWSSSPEAMHHMLQNNWHKLWVGRMYDSKPDDFQTLRDTFEFLKMKLTQFDQNLLSLSQTHSPMQVL